jgi:hypothetical protein
MDIHDDVNKKSTQKGGLKTRLPSFHTSLSLLAINDLDAGAPGPGGLPARSRGSFSRREVY